MRLAGWTKLRASTGTSSRTGGGGKGRRTGKIHTYSKGRIQPVTFVRSTRTCVTATITPSSEGQYVDRRYEPLRAALRDAENVLGRHPALAVVLKADERWQEFVVRIP